MKQFLTLVGALLALQLIGCTRSVNHSATIPPTQLVVIDETQSIPEKDITLSSIAGEMSLIQLEDSDEALVKYWKWAISPNYIVIMQGATQPAKLFDRSGKYIGTVGSVGKGPGEYSMIYECAIDEPHDAIYLTSWFGTVLQYDLKGHFVKEMEVGGGKPTLGILPDGGLTTVSLCWGDQGENRVATTISPDGTIQSASYAPLLTSLKDGSGSGVGFNNEIFAFRNVDHHVFMPTSTDTLYLYSAATNAIMPRCVVSRSTPQSEEWVIGTELPAGIWMTVVGPAQRNYWVDKTTGEVSKGTIINDFLANNPLGQNHFRDGYYVRSYEPGDLLDRIEEKWLADPALTSEQKKRLNNLKETLNPEGNNIVFLAPLK